MADELAKAAAIEAHGLAKRFGQLWALRGVDISVHEGEIMGLVGADGAGKTTCLRLLTGVLGMDLGTARVAGIDVTRGGDALYRAIGYMPQRFSLYTDLSVRENMRFFADIYGVTGNEYKQRHEELMRFSRLSAHADKPAGALSGGMQKKLALSCNLLHRPKVLLLDEPTNGVDPVSRRELWGLLYDLRAHGTTILVSTPYMDEAERCGRVMFLHEGKLIACDTPEALVRMVRDPAESEDPGFSEAFSRLIARTKAPAEEEHESNRS